MSKSKIIVFLAAVCVFAALGFWAWWQIHRLNQANEQLNSELMEANLKLGKAHTQFGDAQKYISKLEKDLQKEIKAHNELITQYGELLAAYNAHGGGSSTTPDPITPPVSTDIVLIPGTIYVAQTDHDAQPFTPPLKYSIADSRLNIDVEILTIPKDAYKYFPTANINYDLHLNILAHFAQTITESGAVNNYAEIYEIDKDGNKVGKFEIKKFEYVVEDQRKSGFRLWAPHLDIALLGGYSDGFKAGASIGLSSSGYGKTNNDLSVRFPRVGLNFMNGIGLDFEPVIFNIGASLPLISNVWVGPFISAKLNREYGVGLLLGAVL